MKRVPQIIAAVAAISVIVLTMATIGAAADVITIPANARALIVAPHPDDAVLGAGGLIRQVVERGGAVQIIETTSGDAFSKGIAAVRAGRSAAPTPSSYRWYGSLREHEAIDAMHELGVRRSHIRLLGFPDEGLCELAADRSPSFVFASPYTRRDRPPHAEQIVPDAKYCADDLRREIAELVVAFRPTIVVVPDGHDEHPDHCAAHLLVHEALALAADRGVHPAHVLHYLIHFQQWPASGTLPVAAWRRLPLTKEERAYKRRAIEAYKSQLSVMAPFLRGFDRADERFTTVEPDGRIPSCWCEGQDIASSHRTQE